MTDISALEAYAGQLSEAAALANASAQTQRQIVNGDALTDVPTESGLVPTLAKQAVLAQAKVTASLVEVASQMAGAMTYVSIAAGLAGTLNDGFFSVPSADNNEYLILYKNVAGVATEVKRYPSVQGVKTVLERVPSVSASPKRVILVRDANKNIPLYLEDGKLGASGLVPSLMRQISDDVGLATKVAEMRAPKEMLPLYRDAAKNVPIYLKKGLFGATGLTDELIAFIQARLVPATPLSTDGRTLFKYRASAAQVRSSAAKQVKVLMTGDSWTELSPVPQAFADRLYALFGKSGDGWITANAVAVTMNGWEATVIGSWTPYDASATDAAPDHGCGVDGKSFWTTGTDSRYVISKIVCTEVEIFYQDLNGTFQYRAYDGGDWQTVVCGNTDTMKSVKLTGLVDNTPRTVEVRTTVANTGTVRIHGLYFTRSAVPGAILNKCGNSGAIARNLVAYKDYVAYYAAKMDPDLIIIPLGTNDHRVNVTVADFEVQLTTLVNTWRAAVPGVGVLLVAPAKTNGVATVPLIQFRDAMYRVARAKGCEFFSLYDDFGTWAEMNALGAFNDNFHPGYVGSTAFAGRVATLFLNDR